MLAGTARAFERRLQRELDATQLRVRWNPDICRFQIGAKARFGSEYITEWHLTVQNPDGSFRHPDQRDIDFMAARDAARHRVPTMTEYLAALKRTAEEERKKQIADTADQVADNRSYYQAMADEEVGGGAVSREEKIAKSAQAEKGLARLVENAR